jgi:hypothetical protein
MHPDFSSKPTLPIYCQNSSLSERITCSFEIKSINPQYESVEKQKSSKHKKENKNTPKQPPNFPILLLHKTYPLYTPHPHDAIILAQVPANAGFSLGIAIR